MSRERNNRRGKGGFSLQRLRKQLYRMRFDRRHRKKRSSGRKNRGLPKGLFTALISAGVVIALALGGFALLNRSGGKPVNVYQIRDQFAMTDYWGDGSQTDGMVGLEGIQPVYLTDTMVVKEVVVKDGETVSKGDRLLTYDTTLTQLDVQLKEVRVRQAELDLTNAQKELATVNSYRAGQLIPIPGADGTTEAGTAEEPTEKPTEFTEDGTVVLMKGEGTLKDPYTYLWKPGYVFNEDFLYQVMRGKEDCYVCFLLTGQSNEADHVHIPDHAQWYIDEQGHYRLCGVCGEEYDRQAHSFLTVVDQYPGVGVEGIAHQVCGVCGYNGENVVIPALDAPTQPTEAPTQAPTQPTEPVTDAPTEPATQAPTEPATQAPTEPATQAPTEPATQAPAELPTQTPESDSAPASNPTPARSANQPTEKPTEKSAQKTTQKQPTVQAQVLMQFQNTEMGRVFQILSISVPFRDESAKEPLFQWKEGTPLPKPTQAPTEKPTQEPVPEPDGLRYTAEQLQQMRLEAESKVRDMDLALRRAKLDYSKAERELNNSAVYATIDGKVKDVISPSEAKDSGSPVLNVTAGGGYYIRCTLSELERDTVEPGQKVTVTSWSDDGEIEGTITEISQYPAQGNVWGSGNSNVSYYPFTVFVSDEANLREGDYVGVKYGTAVSDAGFYLQSMMIRTENGRSYVYVDNNGTLEKRFISTGKSLWGSYTQVLGGITPDDRLAFPYGKDVKDGAATVVASADALYGY